MESTIIDVIKMSWPTVVIVSSILIIMRVTYIIKSENKKFYLHEEIFTLLFIIYLLVLFRLVTSQDISGGGTNLIPFKEINRYPFGSIYFYKQVFGNILLFVPLGYFATSFCKIKGLGGITIIALLSSTIIESVQHYIGRCFDVDDIILNVVGGIIGFLLYKVLIAIRNHLPKIFKKDWFYNILSIIVLLICGYFVYRLLF